MEQKLQIYNYFLKTVDIVKQIMFPNLNQVWNCLFRIHTIILSN